MPHIYLSDHPDYPKSALYRVLNYAQIPLRNTFLDSPYYQQGGELARRQDRRHWLADALAHLYLQGEIELFNVAGSFHQDLVIERMPWAEGRGPNSIVSPTSGYEASRYMQTMFSLLPLASLIELDSTSGELRLQQPPEGFGFDHYKVRCHQCGDKAFFVPYLDPAYVFKTTPVSTSSELCSAVLPS